MPSLCEVEVFRNREEAPCLENVLRASLVIGTKLAV